MNTFILLLYAFPAVAIKVVGNIPIRYLGLPLLINIQRVKKDSILLLIAVYMYILNMIIGGFFFRESSSLDISYIFAFLSCLIVVEFCRTTTANVDRYIKIFLIVNVSYALLQTTLLYLGVDSSYLLFHQNLKTEAYSIPPTLSYLPFLYRYTGLFHESAPFVIYLMFNYIYISISEWGRAYKALILITILFSGSKVGLLFLFFIIINKLLYKIKLNVGYFILFFIAIVPVIIGITENFLLDHVMGTSAGSLYIRFRFLLDTFDDFFSNIFVILFGYGVVPSSAEFGETRGLDFFSIYLYGNGLLGTIATIFPIMLFLKGITKNLTLKERNKINVGIFLALITSGALTIIQYTYLVGFLVLAHRRCSENIYNSSSI